MMKYDVKIIYSAPSVYRQNSRLSRFPPLQMPRYTTQLSYRHSFSDTNVIKPIQIPPLVLPTTTFWQLCIDL